MWPKFPDICLMVEEKPRKNLNQEIDPTGDRTPARCVRSNDFRLTPRTQRWSSSFANMVLGCLYYPYESHTLQKIE